ncbi:MAG: DUF1272 domain-containing protein [Planctomycetes bacterium]|nr:DUF1272 domain-containing protein [Planctomycetota bacterium]
MPLQMKLKCEKCDVPLDEDGDAYICGYECTFCAVCSKAFGYKCPNCSGVLERRPKRKVEPPPV